MGEAKRRAKGDPTFGKPKRGLVVSAPTTVSQSGFTIKSSELDPQELRASLLYWDKLAWPTNNIFHIDGSPDVEFLETAKVLSRPRHNFTGTVKGPEILVLAQAEILAQLDGREPGVWALSQGENSIFLSDAKLEKDAGLAFELYRAIPVPDKDVPLNEILEFRRKRYDELFSLRSEIDGLLVKIRNSENPTEELEKVLKQVDDRCAASIRVGAEWKFPVKLSNLKVSFDLKPFSMARDAILAYNGATFLGLTTSLAAGVAGASAVSSFKITGDFGWKGLRDRTNSYRYVSSFHKELF